MKLIDKLVLAAAIVSGIFVAAKQIIFTYIQYRYKLDIKNAAAIGIIGKADGPTSIFVSIHANALVTTINVFSYATLIFSAAYLIARRTKNNRNK